MHSHNYGDRAMADHFAVSSNRSRLCEAISREERIEELITVGFATFDDMFNSWAF